MKCETVNELLPWYLNGSLSPDERAPGERTLVREHLADCESCRRELEATRQAARIYLAHPSAETLVDRAYGRPIVGFSVDLIDEHVASCSNCAEELALIRQSRSHLEAEESAATPAESAPAQITRTHTTQEGAKVLPGPWNRVSTWRWASLAAGLGFTVAMSGLLVSQQRATALLAEQQARVEAAQSQVVAMKGEVGTLKARVEAIGQGGGAATLIEAASPPVAVRADVVHRSGETATEELPELVRRPGMTLLALTAPSGTDPAAVFRLEIRDAAGRSLSLAALRADPRGGLWINLATASLAPGRLEIDLYPERGSDRLRQYIGTVR